ncbi:MAG: hypothetical protein Kow00108_17730 [Calditrichia bacterium]
MEFFRIVKIKTTEQIIQRKLTLNNLDKISTEIFNLNAPNEHESRIGGIWGEFTLSRTEIKGGVRFSLIECPNALCWTITTGYPPERESIVSHLTINRTKKDQEFIEEITAFLDDMCDNLMQFFSEV